MKCLPYLVFLKTRATVETKVTGLTDVCWVTKKDEVTVVTIVKLSKLASHCLRKQHRLHRANSYHS